MKKHTKSSSAEKEGFKLVSNETFAKGTDSWKEGNKLFVRHRVATGSPDEVKKILGDLKNGAKASMPYAHNIKVYEKEELTPGTNNKVKEKTFIVEENDDIGDGTAPEVDNEPTTETFTASSGLPDSDDFKKWSKNIIDKLIDAKNLQWVAIGLAILVGALGLGMALVR